MVNQYDVIFIDLNPVRGKEKGKIRPCVVISDTDFNDKTGFVWVLPITNRSLKYPTDVPLKTINSSVTGIVDGSQIRTLDLHARDFTVKDKITSTTIYAINDILKGLLNL